MTETQPLVYTKNGNVPAASLRLQPVWEDAPSYTKLTVNYYDGEELVRNDVHVYDKKGVSMDAVAASL